MSPFSPGLIGKAESLIALCRARRLTISTAESCTGGLLIGLLTEIPGSSDVVERGFVTYSNAAKLELLGVRSDLLIKFGAVSDEVARAMAEGALSRSPAALAVSVTGIAGPGGGSAEKPVGLVFFGAARRQGSFRGERRFFAGRDRSEVRFASVETALELLRAQAEEDAVEGATGGP
jgi:nicotinamide-nucleotide amidase